MAILLLPLMGNVAHSQTVNADWLSGSGQWSDMNQWDIGDVPNNDGVTFYNVIIDGNAGIKSIATLSTFDRFAIDSLFLDDGDEIVIQAGASLKFEHSAARNQSGIIDNFGTIFLDSTAGIGGFSELLIDTEATLRSGGTINMIGPKAYINDLTSQNGHLSIENNTIEGQGFIGASNLKLTNFALGRIHANVNGETLRIDTRNNTDFVNQGNLDASLGGTLDISGFTGGVLNNTGGSIRAFDNSQVRLVDSLSITGGTLEGIGTGQIQFASFSTNTVTDATLIGNMHLQNNGTLLLNGTISNQTISIDNDGTGQARIFINGETSLVGNGTVTMNGSSAGFTSNGSSASHLINTNNTIQGQGNFGSGTMGFTNQAGGLVDANVNGATMTVSMRNNTNLVNNGILRASNGGTMEIIGFSNGVLENSLGDIHVMDNSRVELTNRLATPLRVHGGSLTAFGTGEFLLPSFGTVRLDDLTVNGPLRVENNGNLFLDNTVDLDTIALEGAATGAANAWITGDTTLTGNGTITMSGAGARLASPSGAGQQGHLTNHNLTIQGQGRIGDGRLQLTNQTDGIIDANVTGESLLIWTISGQDIVNSGMMKASNGGSMEINGFSGTLSNANGTIRAENGSTVKLGQGLKISGGTLESSGTGIFDMDEFHTVTLSDLTLDGTLRVQQHANLTLDGAISNQSNTILVEGALNNSSVRIHGNASLSGGGTVSMIGANARIYDGTTASLGDLANVDNIIEGSGRIGFGGLRFSNQSGGIVNANVSGLQLAIMNKNVAITEVTTRNDGTFRASNGATLLLMGNNQAQFGGDGIFEALDASSIIFDGIARLENIDGSGNLLSGIWRAIDDGGGASINVTRVGTPTIVNLANGAKVELSGTGSSFTVDGSTIDSTLVGNAGTLTLRNGRVMNTSAGFFNGGNVAINGAATLLNVGGNYSQTSGLTELLDGASLDSTLAVIEGGRFGGNGTVNGAVEFDFGSIVAPGASAGILQFNDDTLIAGTLELELGGVLVGGLMQNVGVVNSTTDFGNIDFDQINILANGVLSDGTTLELSFVNSFQPGFGDYFDVLTGNSLVVGDISLSGPAGYGFDYTVLNLMDSTFGGSRDVLRLTVSSAVPEPSGLFLFTIALVALGSRRIRKDV